MASIVTTETQVGPDEASVALASPWRRWYRRNQRAVVGVLSVGGVLAVWEAAVRLGALNEFFFSSPSSMAQRAAQVFASGEILPHIATSVEEFTLGFLGAVLVGVPLGILAGWYRRIEYLIDPWVTAIYSTPRITLVPLIVIWVGIGLWSKVIAVFLGALFPILLNTMVGVRSTDVGYVKAARCFGAGDARLFRTVVLPGSLHAILTGLRLGIGRGMVGIVAGEFFASNAGLGYLLLRAGQTLDTSLFFTAILLLIVIGLGLMEVLRRIEVRFERWRGDVRGAG